MTDGQGHCQKKYVCSHVTSFFSKPMAILSSAFAMSSWSISVLRVYSCIPYLKLKNEQSVHVFRADINMMFWHVKQKPTNDTSTSSGCQRSKTSPQTKLTPSQATTASKRQQQWRDNHTSNSDEKEKMIMMPTMSRMIVIMMTIMLIILPKPWSKT